MISNSQDNPTIRRLTKQAYDMFFTIHKVGWSSKYSLRLVTWCHLCAPIHFSGLVLLALPLGWTGAGYLRIHPRCNPSCEGVDPLISSWINRINASSLISTASNPDPQLQLSAPRLALMPRPKGNSSTSGVLAESPNNPWRGKLFRPPESVGFWPDHHEFLNMWSRSLRLGRGQRAVVWYSSCGQTSFTGRIPIE